MTITTSPILPMGTVPTNLDIGRGQQIYNQPTKIAAAVLGPVLVVNAGTDVDIEISRDGSTWLSGSQLSVGMATQVLGGIAMWIRATGGTGSPDVTLHATDIRIDLAAPVATSLYLTPRDATVAQGNPIGYSCEIRDQFGRLMPTATDPVTFAAVGASGTWSTPGAVTPVNGVAQNTFTPSSSEATTISVTAAGLAGDSTSLTILGLPLFSYMTIEPLAASGIEGSPQTFTARLFDQYDDPWTAATDVTFSSLAVTGTWGTVNPVSITGGVGTNDFTPTNAGVATIRISAAGVANVDTTYTVAALPTQLIMLPESSSVPVNTPDNFQVVVADVRGDQVIGATNAITISSDQAGTWDPVPPQNAVNGAIIFEFTPSFVGTHNIACTSPGLTGDSSVLTVTAGGSDSFTASWNQVTTHADASVSNDIAGYTLRYGTDPGGPYPTVVDVPGAATTSVQVTGLAEDVYYMTVEAYTTGQATTGAPSAEANVDTGGGQSPPTWALTPNPPNGTENVAGYLYNLDNDCNDADSYAMAPGSPALPAGLSIVGSNIQGTPTTVGTTNNLQVRATNTAGTADSNLFSITVDAATAYVQRYATPTGAGSQDGTSVANAWTMAQANANLVAGQELNIEPGTYNTQIRPANSGTSDGNRIIYRASATPGNIILRGFVAGDGQPGDGAVGLGDRNYISVIGRRAGDPVGTRRIHLWPTVTQTQVLGTMWGSVGCVVDGLFHDSAPGGAHAGNTASRGFGWGVGFWSGVRESRFNIMRNCSFNMVSGGSSSTNTEDIVTNGSGAQHHNVIEDCFIGDCDHSSLYMDNVDSYLFVVRNNEIWNQHHSSLNVWGNGRTPADEDRSLFERNNIHSSYRTVGNTSNYGPGNAFQHGSENQIIRYNRIYDGNAPNWNVDSDGGLAGSSGTSFGVPYSSAGCAIYNNTICNNGGAAFTQSVFATGPQNIANHLHVNNIFYDTDSNVVTNILNYYRDDTASRNFPDRYINCVFGNPGGNASQAIIRRPGTADANLATAQTWTAPDPVYTAWNGFDNSYEASSAMFADYANRDYTPANATLQNAGAPQTVVTAGGGSSATVLTVEDSRPFFAEAGEFPSWMGVQFDTVRIGSSWASATEVQLSAVNDATNQITLASPQNITNGDFVWLAADSRGNAVPSGTTINIGAL